MTKKQNILLICAGLAIAAFIAYSPLRHNGFVDYDDGPYVYENQHVKSGISVESVSWAFTTLHGGTSYWHPLTWLSHMADCELFALNTTGHHFTSLLLHIANTLLLFWIFKKTTGAIWASGFVAALFALHPLNVESVAWIAERKNVLSTFFWMLTIASYIRYAQRPAVRRYLVVSFVFCLALMSKPMVVTLPFVLILLDYWPLRRFGWPDKIASSKSKSTKTDFKNASLLRLVAEKIPLFVLVLALCVITFIAQQKIGTQAEHLPLASRAANALVSYSNYIVKMVFPARLTVFYLLKRLPLWQPIVSFIILTGISAYIIYNGRRRRWLLVGWLWYLGTLVPVIGLVQVGSQAMADRYTYLPLIGIFIIIACGAAEITVKWRYQKAGLGIIAGLILIILSACTGKQVSHWQNDLTLFSHAIEVTQGNFVMYNNYANSLRSRGRLDEAVMYFTEAIQINPQYPLALNNLATVYVEQGKLELAIQTYEKALLTKPDHHQTIVNLGMVLKMQGRTTEAVKKWQEAIDIIPGEANAHYNMGMAMAEQGKLDQAVKHYKASLQTNPAQFGIYHNLGNIYYSQGKLQLAIESAEKAVTMARAAGEEELAGRMQSRLRVYQNKLKRSNSRQ